MCRLAKSSLFIDAGQLFCQIHLLANKCGPVCKVHALRGSYHRVSGVRIRGAGSDGLLCARLASSACSKRPRTCLIPNCSCRGIDVDLLADLDNLSYLRWILGLYGLEAAFYFGGHDGSRRRQGLCSPAHVHDLLFQLLRC